LDSTLFPITTIQKYLKIAEETMSEELNLVLDELDGDSKTADESDLQDIHADQILWKIGSLEAEINKIMEKKAEAMEFYDRKVDSVLKQIDYRSALLNAFMARRFRNGEKTAKMPNGTLKMTTRTTRNLGESDELVKFSYDNDIPTRVAENPDKKAIIEYVKKTGICPVGYNEKEETKFSYKINNNLSF